MKFEEVLPALREGKRIKRKDVVWQNYYGFLFIGKTENKIFSDSVGNNDYKLTKEDLLANDWEIVKEPKKVKVKFRDLTKEQYMKFRKGDITNFCSFCPFSKTEGQLECINCWIYHKVLCNDKFLDQEIEIEEE